ncbi:MAG: polysaccharide deacetylase family protein [Alicyclobacillus sp.]|nr:polysaccharide deacetylase family protein [Alicyclobacillus sp.]
MDFPVRYEPLPQRPPMRLPNGERMAVCVVINVEYFAPGIRSTTVNPGAAALSPDVFNHSWRDYGTRVGIWRLLRMFDELAIPASITLNADVCDHYPVLVEAFLTRRWSLMGHGLTNSQLINGLSLDEERQVINAALDRIERFSGQRPLGWLGPALAETWTTLTTLEALGVAYVCDWLNDEEPYRFDTPQRRLVSMPYSNDLNDMHCFLRCAYTGPEYLQLLLDQFTGLYEESAERPKIMTLPLHPFLVGYPYRAKYLRQALEAFQAHAGVGFYTMDDLYRAFVASAAGALP